MEHKSRKMFAAIAVIMLCAVAIIGVGYAYTASTTNDRNTVNTQYINLYQANGDTGVQGAYQFANGITINWNSADGYDTGASSPATVYTLTSSQEIDVDTGSSQTDTYTLAKVGQSFIIKANQIGTGIAARTCAVAATSITVQTGVSIILEVVNNGNTTYFELTGTGFKAYVNGTDAAGGFTGSNTFTIGVNGDAYYDTTVTVYYGYQGTDGVKVTHEPGVAPAAASAPLVNPVNNGSLDFTVTV